MKTTKQTPEQALSEIDDCIFSIRQHIKSGSSLDMDDMIFKLLEQASVVSDYCVYEQDEWKDYDKYNQLHAVGSI